MTEPEWLECADPQSMLTFLKGNPSKRKLRLFACACARQIRLKADSPLLQEIQLSERFAEGQVRRHELRVARSQVGALGEWSARATANGMRFAIFEESAATAAQSASQRAADFESLYIYEVTMVNNVGDRDKSRAARLAKNKELTNLLREFVGNPFRLVAVDPAWLEWRDGTVKAIAQQIYDKRSFAELPILADALEEAGCTNAEVLAHCRQPGPHVRGCWAVDLILGKT